MDDMGAVSAALHELRYLALHDPLKPPPVDDFDVACHIKTVRNSRALGFDHWCPLEWKALPPEGVHELGCTIRLSEEIVAVPIQALITLMGLLKKPTGGERTIALQVL